MARHPAFRMAALAPLVWWVAADGPVSALAGDRARAIRALLVLQEVARLPSPGLARVANQGVARIRLALGHEVAA